MIDINTEIIKKYGNELIEHSQSLNEIIQEMYDRLINIPTVTFEWQGKSALLFAEKAKKEKLEALKIKTAIYKCGEVFLNCAEKYESSIKHLADKDYVNKMHFDKYNVKNNLDHVGKAYNMMYRATYYPGTIKVPHDFKYANYLKNVVNGNSSIMNNLSQIKELLEKSVQNYDSVISENEELMNDISKNFQQDF